MIPVKRPMPEDSVDSWLMSYADMITLLMCFFIIFVSVSEPKNDKFTEITGGIANKFGSVDLSTPFNGVAQSLQAVVESRQIFRDVSVEKKERSIEMELSNNAFFEKGSIELSKKNADALKELVTALKNIDFMTYRVIVEGHTSDVPPTNTAQFPSNWELSSARAARIVRYFIDQGMAANRLRAVGYADTLAKVPNTDINNNPINENRERNERITIKLERVL